MNKSIQIRMYNLKLHPCLAIWDFSRYNGRVFADKWFHEDPNEN